jgi:hypothetical protein
MDTRSPPALKGQRNPPHTPSTPLRLPKFGVHQKWASAHLTSPPLRARPHPSTPSPHRKKTPPTQINQKPLLSPHQTTLPTPKNSPQNFTRARTNRTFHPRVERRESVALGRGLGLGAVDTRGASFTGWRSAPAWQNRHSIAPSTPSTQVVGADGSGGFPAQAENPQSSHAACRLRAHAPPANQPRTEPRTPRRTPDSHAPKRDQSAPRGHLTAPAP